MKKGFLSLIIFLFTSLIFAQNLIPESLYGLWEGKDRYVFFEENEETLEPQIVIILKTFYGWYYDRAAEPLSYADLEPRDRNDSNAREAEHIKLEVNDIDGSLQEDNAWEIKLTYSKSDVAIIPVAVLDNKMYLDFLVKNLYYDEDGNPIITTNGAWRGNVHSKGLLISDQMEMENIPCYFVKDNQYFDVRYWKSTMDFDSQNAILEYNNESYYVPKHIYSAGNVYACVTGRRIKIRNVWPPFEFKESDYLFNEDKTVMIRDKEPYLIKIADKNTVKDLMDIVKQANSRRRPPEPPLFPPKDLDWHWDIILEAEKYNPYIQEVRRHQAERGYYHTVE